MYNTNRLKQSRMSSSIKPSALPDENLKYSNVVLLLLFHVALAWVMQELQFISTVHAVIVLVLGLWKAITSKDLKEVLPYTAYIMATEILWRMTKADIFWEFSKYAIVLIFIMAMFKQRKIKRAFLPILFFVVLIPSIVLTISKLGFSNASRDAISFNLSGALCLAVCAIAFSNTKLTQAELQKMIWPAIYPILGVFTLALVSTLTAQELTFITESNFVTSGGYGPNQVSAILGLGALLLLLLLIMQKNRGFSFLPFILAIALLTQSILTFSRGGVINVVVALALAAFQLILKPGKSFKHIALLLFTITIMAIFVMPQLNSLTSGTVTERYSDFETTGRIELIEADLELFKNNQPFGVGVGLSSQMRRYMPGTAAHTEYSRLLAEHGVFGVFSILLLFMMFFRAWWKAPDALSKAWVLALTAWALVEMTHAAMRVASIGFVFGWALLELQQEGDSENGSENKIKNRTGFGRVSPRLVALSKNKYK